MSHLIWNTLWQGHSSSGQTAGKRFGHYALGSELRGTLCSSGDKTCEQTKVRTWRMSFLRSFCAVSVRSASACLPGRVGWGRRCSSLWDSEIEGADCYMAERVVGSSFPGTCTHRAAVPELILGVINDFLLELHFSLTRWPNQEGRNGRTCSMHEEEGSSQRRVIELCPESFQSSLPFHIHFTKDSFIFTFAVGHPKLYLPLRFPTKIL